MQDTLLDVERPDGVGRIMGEMLRLLPSIFISRLGWVGMKVTDTALLGHVSSHALTASALSDLWTSATGVLIQGRVLSIFVGNAIGAGEPKLAGEWLQLTLLVQACIAAPVMALWGLTTHVLRAFGEHDASLLDDASYYALILSTAIPPRVIYSALSQFLSAQKLVKSLAFIGLFGLALNLLLGLALVLGVPWADFSGYGFSACPIVTSSVEWSQAAFLVAWTAAHGLHRTAWPLGGCCGWSMRVVTRARVFAYLRLYIPAALSIASDFWRMSLVGAFAASLSSTDLAVFTTSYRLMWISLTLAGSLSAAIGVLLAQHLGAGRVATAKRTLHLGIALAVGLLTLIGAGIVLAPRLLASIFSADDTVQSAMADARYSLALATVTMNLAVVAEGTLMSTGRARTVLVVGLLGSWAGQVPAVALLINVWQRSLQAVYFGVAFGYALLCVLLFMVLGTLDWDAVAKEAQQRAQPYCSTQTAEEPEQCIAGSVEPLPPLEPPAPNEQSAPPSTTKPAAGAPNVD